MAKLNGYDLSRTWFDFCFENPEKIKPNHTALYFFIIEHCNRLGWRTKFGLPTTMAKEAIGIHSYNTYINTLSDLVAWGFVRMIQKSKNQYSSNIIALSKYDKALDKALDKAFIKHVTKQCESIVQSTSESISSINKQVTNKPIKPINNKQIEREKQFEDFWNFYNKKKGSKSDTKKAFMKLTESELEKIKQTLPSFLKSVSDKQFLPYPIRYISKKRWNDEISDAEIIMNMNPKDKSLYLIEKNNQELDEEWLNAK